jgi:hypothetical protein
MRELIGIVATIAFLLGAAYLAAPDAVSYLIP